jgi:hypothetical protein
LKRKRIYGNGIYFSFKPNSRWGEVYIKALVSPSNCLVDLNDELKYEDTDLGKKIIEIGKQFVESWSNSTNYSTDLNKWTEALNKFIQINKFDALLTWEYGEKILIVFKPKIISILN